MRQALRKGAERGLRWAALILACPLAFQAGVHLAIWLQPFTLELK